MRYTEAEAQDVTLCMLVSNRFRHVQDALATALEHVRPSQIVFSENSYCHDQGYVEKLCDRLIPEHVDVKVTPGCDYYKRMAWYRYKQMDLADRKWIVNLDDDDGILGPYSFDVQDHVALLHSHILGICMEESGKLHPFDLLHRRSRTMTDRKMADYFMGCYWAIRNTAYQQVRGFVDRTALYEDWVLAYHVLRLGWSDELQPRVLQYQRLRDFVAAAVAQQETGYNWEIELKSLEYKFVENARYWEVDKEVQNPDEIWWVDTSTQAQNLRVEHLNSFCEQRNQPGIAKMHNLSEYPIDQIDNALVSMLNTTGGNLGVSVYGINNKYAGEDSIMTRHRALTHLNTESWLEIFRGLGLKQLDYDINNELESMAAILRR